jgi:uncharacterized membrane protein YcaP (DUF421 family)
MISTITLLTTEPATEWRDLFVTGIPPEEKVVRTLAVYLFILLLVRTAGKRLMAQMNSLDLVVVLLLSNVVQNAIIGEDNSLIGGFLGAAVLVGANAVLDRAVHRWRWLRWIAEGGTSILVTDGTTDAAALRRLGITSGELASALRRQGADSLAEVRRATLDPGGAVTVDLYAEEQNVNLRQLHEAVESLERSVGLLREELKDRPGASPQHPMT